MQMRVIIAAVMLAAATPMLVQAQMTAPAATAPRPDIHGEFLEMRDVLKIEGEQFAKFEAAVKARNKVVDGFDASEKAKKMAELREARAAAKKANDEAKMKELDAQLEPLHKESWAIRVAQRATVFATLTPAQQQQWVAYILNQKVTKGTTKWGMDEAQLAKAKTLCDAEAAKVFKADLLQTDPYLVSLDEVVKNVRTTVRGTILTDEQRKVLDERDAARVAATKPATKPATQPK